MYWSSGIIRAGLLAALCALWGLSGCSMPLDLDASQQSASEQARQHLMNHEVDRAQAVYAELLVEDPTFGEAAVGKSLTDLLLIAQASQLDPVWFEYLAAEGDVDANSILYADGGVFYWLSRGVPWQDSGEYAGIRSLIGDRLPWPAERISSLFEFTRGVDRPVDDVLADTVALADALAQVERQLRIALDDDSFETFVLPGDVLHAPDATIVLGRAEVAALSSAISFVRGVIYLNAAYSHDWTPEAAVVDADGDGQRQVDHAVGYLDARLFRAVQSPERLDDARDALSSSLKSFRESINAGSSARQKTAIDWRSLSDDEQQQLLQLSSSVQESLYGRTPIPFTEPATTMDLSVFFDQERVLPARTDADEPFHWMVPVAPEDDRHDQVLVGWQFNDAALQRVFVDDVFEPTFQIDGSDSPELQISDSVKRELVPTVAGDLNRDVKQNY